MPSTRRAVGSCKIRACQALPTTGGWGEEERKRDLGTKSATEYETSRRVRVHHESPYCTRHNLGFGMDVCERSGARV